VDTKTVEKKIMQQVDLNGGSMMARDKLILPLSRKIDRGQKCHDLWPDIERGLLSLEEKQIATLTRRGNIISGITRINNDDDSLEETPDATPDTTTQEGITLTIEDDQVGESTAQPVETESGEFKDLPLHKRASYALVALQHRADANGVIYDLASAKHIAAELKIPKDEASSLNVILGKLGFRKTIARAKRHEINMSITEVTAEMIAALPVSSQKPKANSVKSAENAPSGEVPQASSEPKPVSKAKVTTTKAVAPVTSVAQLEARFATIVAKLEAEKETLKAETQAATTRVGELEGELKKVRKDTEKLVAKVCGERDEAQRQLQLLRQAATQPLKLSSETENLLARYEE